MQFQPMYCKRVPFSESVSLVSTKSRIAVKHRFELSFFCSSSLEDESESSRVAVNACFRFFTESLFIGGFCLSRYGQSLLIWSGSSQLKHLTLFGTAF